MHVVSFSLYSQCFKLYHEVHYMFLFLLECFDLLFSICCLTLVAKHCLDFFNKIILILNAVFFIYLVDLLLHINFCYTPLSWANTIVILSSVAMTLLLLTNNQIPLYQSSKFVRSLSNYPRFKTMLFGITVYAVLLYTASIDAVNISSDDIGSIVLFLSEAYSLVILNDSNIFFSALIPVVP